MKYSFPLGIALLLNWLLWSGHFDDPFLIALGVAACGFTLYLSRRMGIVDEEGAPSQLGFRPFTRYAPWLAKEIVLSNIAVAKTILSPRMRLMRNMVRIKSHQRTQVGRVILANSITLTPGTVSVDLEGDEILVHALSLKEAADDLSSDMGERICRLEKGHR